MYDVFTPDSTAPRHPAFMRIHGTRSINRGLKLPLCMGIYMKNFGSSHRTIFHKKMLEARQRIFYEEVETSGVESWSYMQSAISYTTFATKQSVDSCKGGSY